MYLWQSIVFSIFRLTLWYRFVLFQGDVFAAAPDHPVDDELGCQAHRLVCIDGKLSD